MKAALLTDYGPVENLAIVDRPVPEPGPEDVLVRVRYAGLRWGDIMARNGIPRRRHTSPWVPGQEAAGVVERTGANVHDLAPGTPVVALTLDGAFAEYLVVSRAAITVVPEGVPLERMLVYIVNMPVAYLNMYHWGALQPGETALLHAAAGGVGLLTLQVIKRRGAKNTVIALASTDEKLDVCRANGADHVINYKTTDYVSEVTRITEGRGVDVSFNGVAGPTLKTDPRVIRPLGRWVIYGGAGGYGPVDIFRFAYSSITVKPFSIIPFRTSNAPEYREAMEFTREWVRSEALLAPTVYPLGEIREAQRALEQGRTHGKVVLAV